MARYTLEELLLILQSEATSDVVNALRHIQFMPTSDARIQEAILNLFSDKRITIVEIKPTVVYGELAYVAGQTLAYEYAKMGEKEYVVVPNTILPVEVGEFYEIASDEEYKEAEGSLDEKRINLIKILDKKGKLKRGPMIFSSIRAASRLKRRGII